MLWALIVVDCGNAVYIGLFTTNASKLQSVLNPAARLIGASQSSPMPLLSSEPPFTGFLFTGSDPQYLKAYCIPVSSIPSRSTIWSSARGHFIVPRTRTSMTQPRSLLLWAHPTGTSYLSPLETFCQYHLISSASTWKPNYLSVNTRVGSAHDLSGAI